MLSAIQGGLLACMQNLQLFKYKTFLTLTNFQAYALRLPPLRLQPANNNSNQWVSKWLGFRVGCSVERFFDLVHH